MPTTAQKLEVVETSRRRFQLPDLDKHREWFVPRLKKLYPHLTDAALVSWLRSVIYSPEYLFLYQDGSVALFQVQSGHTLSPQPAIEEHFVFCAQNDNPDLQKQAAQFYVDARVWGSHHSASVMTVEKNSDVPHDLVREALEGYRLFNRQEVFCKL